ncbi:MAG: sigma-70 family RNA polymerase sigma factor [Planctomycetota bacterium]
MTPQPAEVDAEVLSCLRAGDVAALERLFQVYGKRVFRVCQGVLGNRADAEDATQEVFLRAFQNAGSFSGTTRFSSWLLSLAVNHSRNLAKAARRHRQTLSDPDLAAVPGSDSPEHHAVERERCDTLAGLLMELPLERRQALVLREMEGLSYAEIAEVLQVPIGTVTSRLIRGREQLRALMAGRGMNPPESG